MTTFSCCQSSPIPWAVNTQNPYDISNWFYGHESHDEVEDIGSRGIMDGPPYGDRYLGAIMERCESSSKDVKSTLNPDLNYKVFIEDDGAGNGYSGQFACINTHYSDCPPSENKYGPCADIPPKDHYWYVRDWPSQSQDDIAECCVKPQGDPSAGDVCKDENGIVVDCNDYSGHKGVDVVSTSRRTLNCSPLHWSGSPLCLPVMLGKCTYDNWPPDDSSSSSTVCDKYMADFSGAPISAKEEILTSALDGWVSEKLNNGDNKPESSDPFVKTAVKYCANYPGLCDIYLQKACKNVTKDDLLNDPNLSKLCGCFLPDDQYMLPGIIPVECNGACAINSHPEINGVTRGQFNSSTGVRNPLLCNQTTCAIDDVAISMINSQVSGSVDFSQLCGNCPNGSCTCVFNDITIDSANSVVSGDIDFLQTCKGCSQSTGGGTNTDVIGCGGGPPPQPEPIPSSPSESETQNIETEIENSIKNNLPFWIAAGILLLILVVGFGAFVYIQTRR